MASTADFRNGLTIYFNNELYTIIEFQHVKPGKGAAFVRTKLKNVKTGKVLPNTFPSGTKVDIARVERRKYQYLYQESGQYQFMNLDDYEQIGIDGELINAPDLMKEGQEVEIVIHADTDTPLFCELPAFVEMQITYAEPGVKGDTATNTMKPATVETGATVRVPLFIEEGEWIRVDTRTHEYSERIKK